MVSDLRPVLTTKSEAKLFIYQVTYLLNREQPNSNRDFIRKKERNTDYVSGFLCMLHNFA